MRIYFIALCAVCLLASCKGKKKVQEPDPVINKDTTQVVTNTADPVNDTLLLSQTNEVMLALKKRDLAALAAMVHPDSGVRFSPYAYIDTASDKKVTADWIREQATKKEVVVWGTVDPTDEVIKLTLDDYIRTFVYDVDFVKPENVKVNQFIGGGNTINNLQSIYPGCNFTESHFSGFEKKYEGMDWRSLRLVFKMKDGKYYLVGVVHDQWTT
jgi:hypothetical protein